MQVLSDDKLATHKETVSAFYDAAYNELDFEKASQYMGPYFIQHDPIVPDGLDGFRRRLDWFKANAPELRVTVKRIFADGDFVITHVHGVREPGHPGSAIVEIFRLEDGKIVEHWDVIQELKPGEAVHENEMF